MKLSSLLLSTAALVVAGSAYAADLPAKKGAPAAKAAATGCPAFGAGYFQIPGGDTCIKFGGRVTYDGTLTGSTGTFTNGAGYRLEVTAMTNTDIGALKSFIRNDGALSKAYISVAGLSVGQQDSFIDLAGSTGNQFGAGYSNPAKSVVYSIPMGPATLSIGELDSNNMSADGAAKRPDVAAKISIPVAGATFNLAAVSHEARGSTSGSAQGSAILSQIAAKAGPIGVLAWGGYSSAAGMYTGAATATNDVDATGGNMSKGTLFGGEVNFTQGATTVALAGTRNTLQGGTAGTDLQSTSYGVFISQTVASHLAVQPEFVMTESKNNATANTTNSTTAYLRIVRDF